MRAPLSALSTRYSALDAPLALPRPPPAREESDPSQPRAKQQERGRFRHSNRSGDGTGGDRYIKGPLISPGVDEPAQAAAAAQSREEVEAL